MGTRGRAASALLLSKVLPALAGGAVVVACAEFDPRLDGVRCAAPDEECPPGLRCVDGVCVVAAADGAVDGPAPDAACAADASPGGDAAADAASSVDGSVDASVTEVVYATGGRTGCGTIDTLMDTWIDASDPDAQWGSDDEPLIDEPPQRRGLMRFDLSAVPPDAKVTDVELTLGITAAYDQAVAVVRLEESWDEHSATWNEVADQTPWSVPGGTLGPTIGWFVPAEIGDVEVALDEAIVAAWVADPAENHGMALVATGYQPVVVRIGTSEAGASARPCLRVVYLP
jgi:hypothetical protein